MLKQAIIVAVALVLLTFLLYSCGSIPDQVPNPDFIYRRDMLLEIDGKKFEGVGVIPARDAYKFHVEARGDLDLFTFQTCHREDFAEKEWATETNRWLFIKKKIEKKRETNFDFAPNFIEKKYCPLELGGYDASKGQHSWAFVDQATPEANIKAVLYCNGVESVNAGVSVCQAKVGLYQGIRFDAPVRVLPDAGCELPKTDADYFEFPIQKGRCVYRFGRKNGDVHRLTTIGYEKILIRQ